MKTRNIAALIVCAALGASAANSSLGFLTTEGSFQLDQSKIWGAATLFEGSLVESKVASVKVHLSNGSEIELAPDSRARFFPGRAVVEKGAIELHSSAAYQVDARSFRVSAEGANTVAAVRFQGAAGVAASASKGRILVASAAGMPLADVPAGKGVTLTPENAAITGLTKLSGCVQSARKLVVLTDQASNIGFVVQGKGVESELGNRVEITGIAKPPALAAKGAPAVVDVSEVNVLERGVCKASAVHKGAIAGVAGGISAKPAAVAIIGGVAVAGSLGAVAAAHALSSDQPASTSR
jgi:hypothetical protein